MRFERLHLVVEGWFLLEGRLLEVINLGLRNGFLLDDSEAFVPISRLSLLVQVEIVKFIVDPQQKLLHLAAGVVVLVLVLAADAQVQRVLTFLLVRPLLETRAFSSESQFDNFVWINLLIKPASTLLNDALHVGALASNDSPGDLELLLVVDLDIVSAGVLDAILSACVRVIHRLLGLKLAFVLTLPVVRQVCLGLA